MNKEQRKFKKVIKARIRHKIFERQQVGAKAKKDVMLKRERIAYKFDKLERKIEREKYIKNNPPVSQVMSPQKVV